ncbi:amino acid adenylation domain-containing protein [Robbsia sp. KACC 23696]|uniref:non-ribosomal peptide synthetase n=1 Tax=Robbsia sp. KACC 23696 TaxID=3149231 RepID=UPI00325B2AEE
MSNAIHQAENVGHALSAEQQVVLAAPMLRDNPAVFRATLSGAWRDADLQRAFENVFARHEILQTTFRETPGYALPRQYPCDGTPPRMETIDAMQASREDLVQGEREAARLGTERLVRCVLLRHTATHARLVLSASRLVADEAGLARLYRDALHAYGPSGGDAPIADSDTEDDTDDGVIQYTQFVEWREELALGDDAHDGAAYWTAYLAQMAADQAQVPALPYRRSAASEASPFAQPPRAAAQEAAAQDTRWVRAIDIDDTLDAAARQCGVPTAVLTQAAWWLLLARIAGDAHVVGAWQHDCRDDAEMLENGIGAFVRTYPVALNCDATRPFAAFAQECATVLDAHRSSLEYWPATPATRDDALPTFDRVAFATARIVPDLSIDAAAGHRSAFADRIQALLPGYELALQIDIDAAGTPRLATLSASADCYAANDVDMLLRQYQTLLAAIASNATAPLGDLAIDSPERQRALRAWRGETKDWGTRTVPAAIAAWAVTRPDAPALVAPERSLSYAELEACVVKTVALLAAHGVGRGGVVGLSLPRSAGLVVALLAAMRAGAAYLPLDPSWPASRRDEIVAQAGAGIVLCERGAAVSSAHVAFDLSDAWDDTHDTRDTSSIAAAADDGVALRDDSAYVLYTSGSTGKPKGVKIGHRQLLNYVAGSSAALGLAHCTRFALTSTIAADLGNTTLFGALYNGACLVIPRDEDMKDAQSFAQFLRSGRIDCVKITPSHFGALTDAADITLPRVVILGGEPVPVGLAARIKRIDPTTRVFNHYGPTETTVGVLVHEYGVSSGEVAPGPSLPLTLPLPNCYAYVLDAARRLAPVGMPGELYIGGAQLSDGYVEQANADVFVDDPFQPGQRLYRSGDRARYVAGGGVQLIGRADAQVKIRGFRIEPAEIEAALLTIDTVREAAIRAWGDDTGRQLAAYIVLDRPDSDVGGDIARLSEALASRLPAPMLPAHWVIVAHLPRLANGKIDRRTLPDPRLDVAREAAIPPGTALETLLLRVISQLLGNDLRGVNVSLFEAGADSLVAIRLASRIRELLHIEMLPGLVFAHPSVARLARALLALEPSPGAFERTAALRLKLDAMTPAQRERMLQLARDRAAQEDAGMSGKTVHLG